MTAEEVIQPGAKVLGRDGEKLGTVAYVVVDPSSMHITDIVVSTGGIIGRDIVLPRDKIDRIEGGAVHVAVDKQGLEACKDYVDIDYKAPPPDWTPAPEYAYPTGAMLWPAGMYYPEATSITVNTPPGTVGLHEGMHVESSDGHKVGSIDALETDPRGGDVTHIVVKQGFILTHDFAIPAGHVKTVESDRVKLDLTRDEIERRFGTRS